MNRAFTYILTLGLLMIGGGVMGQRDNVQPQQGGQATNTSHGVIVGGSVFGGGNLANVAGSSSVTINQTQLSDGTQVSASIAGDVYGGGAKAHVNSADGENLTTGATTSVTLTQGNVTGSVYGGGLGVKAGVNGTADTLAQVFGPVTVNINGGTVSQSVFGCNNYNGAPQSTVVVNVNGGTISQNVFGGGNLANYANTPVVNIDGGSVAHKVVGGGNQANVGGGNVNIKQGRVGTDGADDNGVYGGCNELGTVSDAIIVNVTGGTIGTDAALSEGHVANVFGGGYGYQTVAQSGITVNISKVTGDGAPAAPMIYGDVYGGSAMGTVNAVEVNVLEGTIEKRGVTVEQVTTYYGGNVYGGGLGTSQHPAVVNGVVEVNIGEGTVNSTTGYATSTSGNATIKGSVFGCNNAAGSPADNVTVNIFQTHRETDQQTSGSGYALAQVFGGGNQAHYEPVADKQTTVHVWTCDNTIQYVYGGGNAADVGTQNVNSATNVIIDGGRIEWVFGGGNGAGSGNPGANIHGNVNVTYHAGDLTYLFGGSNEKGNISGTKTVDILADGVCPTKHIAELYGGSNMAPITGNVELTMDCQTGMDPSFKIGSLFGGSRRASITGNVTLNLEGGKYDYVFGGNNEDGTITGDVTLNLYGGTINEAAFGGNKGGGSINGNITVNVEDANNSCPLIVKDVFGAGDQAMYTAPTGEGAQANNPIVYVKHLRAGQTISGNVYGGGNGDPDDDSQEPGMVTGNPKVVIGDMTEGYRAAISGNVYGGGNAAKVDGTTTVLMQKDNSTVAQNIYGGGNLANVTGATDVDINGGTVSLDVYGGGALANTGGSNVTLGGGTVTQDIYGGGLGDNGHAAEVNGAVQVTVNSGVVRDVYGCNNTNGAPTSTVRVDINNKVSGNVYGGGNQAGSLSGHDISPEVYVNNGTVVNVFGGGKGNTAIITGNPQVTIGDAESDHYAVVTGNVYGGGDAASVTGNTKVIYNDNNNDNGTNYSYVANLFGGGNAAGVTGEAEVNMILGKVTAGIYGGCNASGAVGGTATVNVTGGTIGTSATNTANIYGGGLGVNTRMSGNVAVNIGATNGATPPEYSGNAVVWGDVYGGSAKGKTNCNEEGNAQQGETETDVTLYSGTLHGDLYGGGHGIEGALAHVYGPVQVTVNGGTVTGSVYGCNNAAGAPQSTVKVDVYGTDEPGQGVTYALANVFGGGNQAAYNGSPDVTIHNCNNSIGYVYGGGNKAPVVNTNVIVYGGNTIGYVFGGGNGEGLSANTPMVTDNAEANIYGGTIGHVFGGNNSSGAIGGTVTVNVDKQTETNHSSCPMYIGEVYGGGNEAAGNAGTITIGCTGTWTNNHNSHNNTNNRIGYELEGIGTVYGGANKANVNNGIDLNIVNGIVENVFGGNNTSGSVNDTIRVTINKGSGCDWYVGNVYGGGNLAQYGAPNGKPDYPKVRILNGTVSGDVFGGGLGSTGDAGKVTGNPQVTINGSGASVSGGVYGGGSLAPTVGAPAVTLTNGALTKVFGGGKAADVNGAPTVNINGGTVSAGVYGGCDSQGNVSGKITVNVTGGTMGSLANLQHTPYPITVDVYGGGFGEPTTTGGDVEVNVSGGTIYGDVYGGSALGKVNTENGSNTTTVNVTGGTLETYVTHQNAANGDQANVYNGGNVYGGGLGEKQGVNGGTQNIQAKVYGTVEVNIGTGTLATEDPDITAVTNLSGSAVIKGNVYGCNNTNGSPQQNVTVNVFQTGHPSGYVLPNVFGGGNMADFTVANKTANVNIYTCNNVIGRVFGGGNAAATNSVRTMVQGGTITEVYGGGNGEVSAANVNGTATLVVHGGTIGQTFAGSNQQGTITGGSSVTVDNAGPCATVIDEFFCGGNYAPINGNVVTEIACGSSLANMQINNLYGGCNMADITGNVELTVRGGKYLNIYGGSKGVEDGNNTTDAADISGTVTLNIYGGKVGYMEGDTEHEGNIFGGSNYNGSIGGKITVNVENQESGSCALDVSHANVFGGGNIAVYTGQPDVNIKHCTVKNVYGGGNGKASDLTQTKGSTGSTNVTIGDNNTDHTVTVTGNVYGGGNAAKVNGSTTVLMQNAHSSANKLFGGGNQADVTGAATVTVNDGTVNGGTDATHNGVYGGCNDKGNVGGLITLNVNKGTLGTNTTDKQVYVHGGGYGENTTTSGSVEVNVGNGTATPAIYGDIYGGSALGVTNGTGTNHDQTNTTNHTHVNLIKGTVNGSVYGGGLGRNANTSQNIAEALANVYSPVTVTVTKGKVTGAVYGCNNVNGSPKSTVAVTVNGTDAVTSGYAIQGVYGGGNLAAYDPTTPYTSGTTVYPMVTVNGCASSIKDVFGGGNAAPVPNSKVVVNGGVIDRVFAGGNGESGTPAHIGWKTSEAITSNTPSSVSYGTGIASAEIKGGTIVKVFGGSNANGEIRVSSAVDVDKNTANGACDMKIGEVYGGGNLAAGKAGTVTIGCTGTLETLGAGERYGYDKEGVNAVYGGANDADVTGNITLNITSGIVENVFGGNNVGHTVSGNIVVNINKGPDATCAGNWYVGNVYGGGNQASYGTAGSNYPQVNLLSGTVSHDVFGGGLGSTATVTGNPVVNVNGGTVSGTVFGGGSAAPVVGNPTVNAYKGVTSDLYGGGLGATATVTGNPTVKVDKPANQTLTVEDVFGGGYAAPVEGGTSVQLKSGTVANAFGGGNEAQVSGTTSVSLEGATASNLYGGGNQAGVTQTATVSVSSGLVKKNGNNDGCVYGGCNSSGIVGSTTKVELTGGTVQGSVFGGGYGSGTEVTGKATVEISGVYTAVNGDVYGGGNQGEVKGGTDVKIKNAD